jgi:hypothetical protein
MLKVNTRVLYGAGDLVGVKKNHNKKMAGAMRNKM